MLIDDVTITVASGKGGTGAVAFNKNMMSFGPAGGSGGDGGNVYMEGVADLSALRQYRNRKEFYAENGEGGKRQFNDGHDGEHITLKVPVGTVIHNLDTGVDNEIVKIGEKILIAKGGHGGKGNYLFRSPDQHQPDAIQGRDAGRRIQIASGTQTHRRCRFYRFAQCRQNQFIERTDRRGRQSRQLSVHDP